MRSEFMSVRNMSGDAIRVFRSSSRELPERMGEPVAGIGKFHFCATGHPYPPGASLF